MPINSVVSAPYAPQFAGNKSSNAQPPRFGGGYYQVPPPPQQQPSHFFRNLLVAGTGILAIGLGTKKIAPDTYESYLAPVVQFVEERSAPLLDKAKELFTSSGATGPNSEKGFAGKAFDLIASPFKAFFNLFSKS